MRALTRVGTAWRVRAPHHHRLVHEGGFAENAENPSAEGWLPLATHDPSAEVRDAVGLY